MASRRPRQMQVTVAAAAAARFGAASTITFLMRVREPVNAWSHFVGLILATGRDHPAAAPRARAGGDGRVRGLRRVAGAALRARARSTTRCRCPPDRLRPLRTLDHIAIYFLIAGTYTPVAVVTLHGHVRAGRCWRRPGRIAVAGIPFKIWWLDAPVWISTGIYLAMGYMALLAAAPLAAAVSVGGLAWLVAGGVAYTVGAIIFSRERPNPCPGRVRAPRDLAPVRAGRQRVPLRLHAAPRGQA